MKRMLLNASWSDLTILYKLEPGWKECFWNRSWTDETILY